MDARFRGAGGRAFSRLMFLVGLMGLTGCLATRAGNRAEGTLAPHGDQTRLAIESWTGEYRGVLDHGRWFLATGSPADEESRPNSLKSTEGWQWDRQLPVDVTIRFVPDETGGRLNLVLNPVDTTRVHPWNLSYNWNLDDLERLGVPRRPLSLDFGESKGLLTADSEELSGSWVEKVGRVSESYESGNERGAEFRLKNEAGRLSGTIKYNARHHQIGPSGFGSEEKHEMVLSGLSRREAP